jgi:hypothetical protein
MGKTDRKLKKCAIRMLNGADKLDLG